MLPVLAAALGVGGATIVGAAIGYLCKGIPERWNDSVIAFAAGVMLVAALIGLIEPAADMAGNAALWQIGAGLFTGALFLCACARLTPCLERVTGLEAATPDVKRVLLFVFAIAVHNFPEGLAAGVSFGSGDIGGAIAVAAGIALQNFPEGAVVVAPLRMAGVSPGRAFLIAAGTGVIEIIGTFAGYYTASFSAGLLPFALSFAGGTMLYVICSDMIPSTHCGPSARVAIWSLLSGMLVMLVLSRFL